MANVVFKNVFKEYLNGVLAVNDLSLEVKDKEFIVLVGPSGCGKSTCLRIVAGLEGITSGEVLIDGIVVNQVPPKDRDIAMVFQNYALYPHMTVYENMSFGLKLRKVATSEIDKKVKEILNNAYLVAKDLITKNKDLHIKISEDLLSKEEINKEEFDAYFI